MGIFLGKQYILAHENPPAPYWERRAYPLCRPTLLWLLFGKLLDGTDLLHVGLSASRNLGSLNRKGELCNTLLPTVEYTTV